MSLKVLFTRISGNTKTGLIPVSTSVKNTCPDACPLKKGGCYAAGGHVNIHWLRLSKGLTGIDWKDFLKQITHLPRGQLWRHNQAGDLPGENNAIDCESLASLVKANKGRKGFTYTHKPVLPEQADKETIDTNVKAIADANKGGFVINLSANSLAHADRLKALGIGPVVTLLPATQTKNTFTEQGHKVVICPATYREGVSCASCKLCSVGARSVIVGFPAHGMSVKKANAIALA